MKTKIKAEIVAHSINEQGDELVSVLATFPRIILAEVNTHRMLSKNTSSSRAIPFKKMVESVKNDPFIPIAWQRGHSGMQGSEYLTGSIDIAFAHDLWLEARDRAVRSAMALSKEGTDRIPFVTKQLANRLLEPFMWTTMLITGSREGWDNFFKLRCPSYEWFDYDDYENEYPKYFKSKKEWLGQQDSYDTYLPTELQWLQINKGQAEIHIMDLAEKIYNAMDESTPRVLKAGQWHIPFINNIVKSKILGDTTIVYNIDGFIPDAVKISTAMAARTSYTVVGEEKVLDYEALIGLHDRLIAQDPPHSSPLEHCAKAMSDEEYKAYTKTYPEDEETNDIRKVSLGWCNNFKGFIPYRYMVDNG